MPRLEVDHLLVEGEVVDGVRVWPSQREVARRFGVAPSLVALFSKQRQCGERRASRQAEAAEPSRAVKRASAPAPAPAPSSVQLPVEGPVGPLDSPPEPAWVERFSAPALASAPAPAPSETKRRPGRPRKAEAPLVPYEEVDRLLVYGEATMLETGAAATVYPTHRQLAERYGVSPSIIAGYAQSRNCRQRREQAAARMAKRTEDKLVELRSEAIAVGESRLVQMIDTFLLNFEKALEEGRVRSDNPTDVNTLARLKVFILGGADSRQEVRTMLSLESLQERHARMMREQRDATPEMGGVIDVRAVGSDQREAAQFPADRAPAARPPQFDSAAAVEESFAHFAKPPPEGDDEPEVGSHRAIEGEP
jgi:hypothetical protein